MAAIHLFLKINQLTKPHQNSLAGMCPQSDSKILTSGLKFASKFPRINALLFTTYRETVLSAV